MSGLLEKLSSSSSPAVPVGHLERPKGLRKEPIAERNIVVGQKVGRRELRHLLESLSHETCAHSWRNFDPAGSPEDLIAWENDLRPTEIFFFHLEVDGHRQLIGGGAVSSRLSHDFPGKGFCVLGRCYILPEFRGRGMYRRFLRYRIEHCRERLGDQLEAIHIGSTDERVARVLRNHRIADWPNFSHLGHQQLEVADEIMRVEAYLLLLPSYIDKLSSLLGEGEAPPEVAELRDELAKATTTGARELGRLAEAALIAGGAEGWFEGRDCRALEKLILFCKSIPLAGFSAGE